LGVKERSRGRRASFRFRERLNILKSRSQSLRAARFPLRRSPKALARWREIYVPWRPLSGPSRNLGSRLTPAAALFAVKILQGRFGWIMRGALRRGQVWEGGRRRDRREWDEMCCVTCLLCQLISFVCRAHGEGQAGLWIAEVLHLGSAAARPGCAALIG